MQINYYQCRNVWYIEAVRDLNTEINRFGFVLCYYEIFGTELVAQRLKQLGCSPFKNPACTSKGFKTI